MLVQLVLLGALAAPPRDALPEAPFTATIEQLRAAADAFDEDGAPAEALLNQHLIDIDAEGLAHRVEHYIIAVHEEAAVDRVRDVRTSWDPWREATPVVRGRVFAPDGTVSELDPATLVHGQTPTAAGRLYGRTDELIGPLPRVVPGSILEVSVTRQDAVSASLVGASGIDVFPRQLELPTLVNRTRWRTPVERPLLTWAEGAVTVERHRQRGMEVAVAEVFDPKPRQWRDGSTLAEGTKPTPEPRVRWSIVGSWKSVADAYATRVAPQVDPAGFEDVLAHARETTDRTEQIRRVLRGVQGHVEYTGLEVGERMIFPYRPLDVRNRGYGDCKDQATAVVALLTELGIPAHLALLRASHQEDLHPPEFVHLGRFNHVIVYVPGPTPLWIDPTSRTEALGELPTVDMDRWALLVGSDHDALVRTPTGTAWLRMLIRFGDDASGGTEPGFTFEGTGWFASLMRQEEEKLRKSFIDQGVAFEGLEPDAPLIRVTPTLPGGRVGYYMTARRIVPGDLVARTQDMLAGDQGRQFFADNGAAARLPARVEMVFEAAVPPGFAVLADPLPPDRFELGNTTMTRTVTHQDGVVRVAVQLDKGPGPFPETWSDAWRAAQGPVREPRDLERGAVFLPLTKLDDGHLREAFSTATGLIADPAHGVAHQLHWAGALDDAGLRWPAARLAVAYAEATNTAGAWRFAYSLQRKLDDDTVDTVAMIARAVALDPDEPLGWDVARDVDWTSALVDAEPTLFALLLTHPLSADTARADIQRRDFARQLVHLGRWDDVATFVAAHPDPDTQPLFDALLAGMRGGGKALDASLAKLDTPDPLDPHLMDLRAQFDEARAYDAVTVLDAWADAHGRLTRPSWQTTTPAPPPADETALDAERRVAQAGASDRLARWESVVQGKSELNATARALDRVRVEPPATPTATPTTADELLTGSHWTRLHDRVLDWALASAGPVARDGDLWHARLWLLDEGWLDVWGTGAGAKSTAWLSLAESGALVTAARAALASGQDARARTLIGWLTDGFVQVDGLAWVDEVAPADGDADALSLRLSAVELLRGDRAAADRLVDALAPRLATRGVRWSQGLVDRLLAAGRPDAVRRLVAGALERRPGDAQLIGFDLSARTVEDADAAGALAVALLARHPGNAAVVATCAEALDRVGRRADAAAAWASLGTADAAVPAALDWVIAGEPARALTVLDELAPTDDDAYIPDTVRALRVVALARTGDVDGAWAALQDTPPLQLRRYNEDAAWYDLARAALLLAVDDPAADLALAELVDDPDLGPLAQALRGR